MSDKRYEWKFLGRDERFMQGRALRPGNVVIKQHPVPMIVEYTDKIIEEVDVENNPVAFRTGHILRIMPCSDTLVVDDNDQYQFSHHAFPISTEEFKQQMEQRDKANIKERLLSALKDLVTTIYDDYGDGHDCIDFDNAEDYDTVINAILKVVNR